MTGIELVDYLRCLYGSRWDDRVEFFGGRAKAIDYLDGLVDSGTTRFSYRVGAINRMFPSLGDEVPRVDQVGLIVQGRLREAAGVPDLMRMIEMLVNYRGVVLPLGHPSIYWFKSTVLHEFGADFLDELKACEDVGRYVPLLKPVYRQIVKKVEGGFCHDYPQFVQRELILIENKMSEAAWLRAPFSRECEAAGHRALKNLKSKVRVS